MAIAPRLLEAGDTIGIVTLGSPLSADIINARIQFLEDMGFQVVVGAHVYEATGFLAGPAEDRAADLMEMFRNEQVKLILPTRGGVGVEGILPYLDFDFIKEHPKLISGYSDITVLLNALFQFSNLITLHSLLLINFNASTPAYNYNQFFAATSEVLSMRVIENPPEMPQISVIPGNVTGPIIGGNLTSLISTLGTPYEIDTSGAILVLEETNEPVNTVFRYLNMLMLSGKFDDCAGIVMGECTGCVPAYSTSYQDLIEAVIVPLGKPLMINLATGHGYYKAAIPIGAMGNLNTETNTFTVIEPAVTQ